MKAIFKKEFNAFFSNTTGFLVLGLYWVINVLFLWFFTTDYSILNAGSANLVPFFELSAWVFIFLIPAICMKSFSEEQKSGTLELLYTKPISKLSLVLGKFWGALAICGVALLPSLLFVVCIRFMIKDSHQLDFPALWGSYLGLILLSACYIAIALLASAWSKNQILSFTLGAALCFVSFFALEGISHIALFGSSIYALEYLSLSFHYKSLSRGVIDTRNMIYFLSFTALLIAFCIYRLKKTQAI